MSYFLVKTDPQTYSIAQLEQDKATIWDGVRNAQAVLTIQRMQPGDDLLIYHSMKEAALVGLARVVSEPRPDADDPKSWVVDIVFVRRFAKLVTLHEIKATHLFEDWSLVRQSRLSTMGVPDTFVSWLQKQGII